MDDLVAVIVFLSFLSRLASTAIRRANLLGFCFSFCDVVVVVIVVFFFFSFFFSSPFSNTDGLSRPETDAAGLQAERLPNG